MTSQPSERLLLKRKEITSVGEDVEKRDLSYTTGGNANWYSHYGNQYQDSSKRLRTELPYHLAIPLLDIYQTNMKL